MQINKPSFFILVASTSLVLSLVLHVVGLVSTQWITGSITRTSNVSLEYTVTDFGLFQQCDHLLAVNETTSCQGYEDEPAMAGCLAVGVVALLLLVATTVITFLNLVLDVPILKVLPIAGAATATVCIMIQFIVFAAVAEVGKGGEHGYSFVVTVVSSAHACIAFVFFLLDRLKKVRPPKEND